MYTNEQETLIAEFIERSEQNRQCAIRCLKANDWDVEMALVMMDNEEY